MNDVDNDDVMKDFNFDVQADDANADISAILDTPEPEVANADISAILDTPEPGVADADIDTSVDMDGNFDEIAASGDANEQLQGVPSDNLPFLKWYDGSKNYKSYDIAKDFTSANFNGTDDCDTIHINVGFNTYGWLVVFADGVTMSLPDVREYQLRHGCLPLGDGRITYGNSVLDFNGVKRIVIYESVKYFSYGA